MTMAHRLAVMSKGRVLQVGSPEAIYKHPVNRFVADFIGSVNLFEGTISVDEADRCAVATALGEMHVDHGVEGALHMPVALAVRPEKIEIARQRPAGVTHNLFTGRVREIAYLGSYNTFIVESDAGQRVKITGANSARQDLSDITWEEPVFFWWPADAGVVLRD